MDPAPIQIVVGSLQRYSIMSIELGQSMTHREDYDLAVKMKKGDESALLTFTRKHEQYVFRWASTELEDRRDAQDLKNKIFAETWQYLIPRWDTRHGVFTSYFKRFVRWHINNEIKRLQNVAAKVRMTYVDDEDVSPLVLADPLTPYDRLIADEKGERITRAIDKALQKVKIKNKRIKMRCWRLRNKKGMLTREIAKATGLSAQKVSNFIRQINLKLREILNYEALMKA